MRRVIVRPFVRPRVFPLYAWARGARTDERTITGSSDRGRPGTMITFGHGLTVVNVNVNGAYVPYTRRREARAQPRAQPRARSHSVTIEGFGG